MNETPLVKVEWTKREADLAEEALSGQLSSVRKLGWQGDVQATLSNVVLKLRRAIKQQ